MRRCPILNPLLCPPRTALLCALLSLTACRDELAPTERELDSRAALGERLAGAKLLWVRGDKIFYSPIASFEPQRVTVGNVVEQYPRWSPDGKQIAFSRGLDIWIMNADFTGQRRLIELAQWPAWADGGKAVTAVEANRYQVLKHDLETGETKPIFDTREPPQQGYPLWRFAELHPHGRFLMTFRLEPQHIAEVIDLDNGQAHSNDEMKRGDCQPAWSPDGSYAVMTANTHQRPIRRMSFDPTKPELGPSTYLVGFDTPYKYWHHGQRVSNDGRWLVFFSEFFEGPEVGGASEIYLWEIGRSDGDVVRLTFHAAADEYPSLYVPQP